MAFRCIFPFGAITNRLSKAGCHETARVPVELVGGADRDRIDRFGRSGRGPGAYGQGIPATGPGADDEVACPGVNDHVGHRTNVGVLNTSGRVIAVEVTIVDSMGVQVGSETWQMQPFEQRQQRVTTLGGTGLDGGTSSFRLLSAEGSFLAYSSVVDNQTGDAVYVAGN